MLRVGRLGLAVQQRLSSSSAGLSFGKCEAPKPQPSELSDDQRQLKSAVDHFVKEEIIPVAAKYDQSMEFPWEVIKKAHANGFMNIDIPAECGGLDLDLVSNCLVSESTGYGCTGIGTALMANDLASTPLILAGSEQIKKKFLGRLIEEPLMAVSWDPSSDSPAVLLRNRARSWFGRGRRQDESREEG